MSQMLASLGSTCRSGVNKCRTLCPPRLLRRAAEQWVVQGIVGVAEVWVVEDPHWGLFRVPNDGIISADSLGSDMLARKYPRGTAGRAVSVAPKKLARTLILILGTLGFNFVCQGCHSQKSSAGPSIEFTHIPPMAQGGRERVDTISGRARNARPKQQIVIYAHSGPWWVQPWPPYLGS